MFMNRRKFLASGAAALATAYASPGLAQLPGLIHGFPPSEMYRVPYIEKTPVPEYHWAPASAYEAFQDMKVGVRIHWGIYSIWHRGAESTQCCVRRRDSSRPMFRNGLPRSF
jgi:hypothetical protein